MHFVPFKLIYALLIKLQNALIALVLLKEALFVEGFEEGEEVVEGFQGRFGQGVKGGRLVIKVIEKVEAEGGRMLESSEGVLQKRVIVKVGLLKILDGGQVKT